MPFVNREDLEQLDTEISELRERVERYERAGGFAVRLIEGLELYEASASTEEEALAMAAVVIEGEEKERIRTQLSQRIIERRRGELAHEYAAKNGGAIMKEIKELFETDGTYEALASEVEEEIRAQLTKEVIAQKKAEIEAALRSDISTIQEEMGEEYMRSEEANLYRLNKRGELEAGWKADVSARVLDQITQEELDRKADFMAEYREKVLANEGWMSKKREEIRTKFETEWKELTVDEIVARINDEELTALVEKNKAAELEKARAQDRGRELADEFMRSGIDPTRLLAGDQLYIYLGNFATEVRDENKTARDRYGESRTTVVKVNKKVVTYARKLELTARGDGVFVIDKDTLSDSRSPYETQAALPQGSMIEVGRRLINGHDDGFEARLAADVNLIVVKENLEDKTVHTPIIDTLLPVADVRINGTSARGTDIYELKK